MKRSITKVVGWLTTTLVAMALVVGLSLAASAPASAASANCRDGRCTVYLSKAETKLLSQGRAPALPASAPWQLKGAYLALVQGHRWIAGQYANRGWCSAFRLSIYPWEAQGYDGYRC